MSMKTGEKYRCPDPACACEVEVTHGAAKANANHNPRCCCGREMEKLA